MDEWNKIIAPSSDLRKWFGHNPQKFEEFKKLYREELKKQKSELIRLKSIDRKQNLTLLYAARDPVINHANILLDVLKKLR